MACDLTMDVLARQFIMDYLASAHREFGNTCCLLIELLDHVLHQLAPKFGDECDGPYHSQSKLLIVRKVISKLRADGKVVISSRPVPLVALRPLMESDRFVYVSLQHHSTGSLWYSKMRSDKTVSMYATFVSEGMQHALLRLFREPGTLVVAYTDTAERDLFVEIATDIARSHGNQVLLPENGSDIPCNECPTLVIFMDKPSRTTTDLYKMILQMPINDVKMLFITSSAGLTDDSSFISDLCRSHLSGFVTLDSLGIPEIYVQPESMVDQRSVMCTFLEDLKAGRSCTWIRNMDLYECANHSGALLSSLYDAESSLLHSQTDLVCMELSSDKLVWEFSTCKPGYDRILCCDTLEYIVDNGITQGAAPVVATCQSQLAHEVERMNCHPSKDPIYLCITSTFACLKPEEWYSILVSIVPRCTHIVATQSTIYKQFGAGMSSSQTRPTPYTCLRKFLAQNSFEYQE